MDRAPGDRSPGRILVTGASGFVGRHLVAAIAKAFPTAVLLTTPATDLREKDAPEKLVRDAVPDVCVHLAAASSVVAAQHDEDNAWQVNLHASLGVARAILRHVPHCQMLFVSSSEVYGTSFRTGEPLDEQALLAPANVYSATKAAADLAIGSMATHDGLRAVRLRPFNHTGPGQSAEFVVSSFARQIARIAAGVQPPSIQVGNLESRRDFLDVRDVCAAYVACIAARDSLPPNTVLNLASGEARRIGDVLSDLQAISGIEFETQMDEARMRPSDLPLARGNALRAATLLDWNPSIPWRQTLHDLLGAWKQRVIAEAGAA